jgi:hypothetical protein
MGLMEIIKKFSAALKRRRSFFIGIDESMMPFVVYFGYRK